MIVVACTIYAAYTESDFTTSYGIIIVLTAALFTLFIVTLFTSSPFIQNLYCCIGVMLFAPRGLWGLISERTGLQLFPVRRRLVALSRRHGRTSRVPLQGV